MAQTAIEWLLKELDINPKASILKGLIEQAKEMEKQQMKHAVLAQSTKHEGLRKIFDKQFEEYYTETYNK